MLCGPFSVPFPGRLAREMPMTKAWHADELAALQALLQEQGDTGVDWDGLARQLRRGNTPAYCPVCTACEGG